MTTIRMLRRSKRLDVRLQSPRKWPLILAFLAPALLLYMVFVLLPIFQAMYYSLFHWNGLEPLTDFAAPCTTT